MEIQLEEYNKILHIEAMTMSDMVREEITAGVHRVRE